WRLTVASRRLPAAALSGFAALPGLRVGAFAVPSWPLALMRTRWVDPERVVPLTPARKAAVWSLLLPIRIVPASPFLPSLAMSTLSLPVSRFWPAWKPIAMLWSPALLFRRALSPTAALAWPALLLV